MYNLYRGNAIDRYPDKGNNKTAICCYMFNKTQDPA